ncbi:MAG: WhiB family transcriptional regulator [Collinsella sp.]
MFLKGECADFPDSWSDRMWGPDDLPNRRTQYELRRAAVRICEACPVRAECLAFGIMVQDQYGIYGGLPLRARRQVLKIAQEAGFRFDPNDPTAEQRLARFIRANPEIVAAARERECRRRKYRAARPHASNDGAPPHARPARRRPRPPPHTPRPCRTPSSENNPIRPRKAKPSTETRIRGKPWNRAPVDTGSRKTIERKKP